MKTHKGGALVIVLTIITTAIVTAAIGAVVVTRLGVDRVAQEVSPLVEKTTARVTEGIVPDIEKGDEPKTDADLIMDGVAANTASTVLIYETTSEGPVFADEVDGTLVARGVIVSSDGKVLTDASSVDEEGTYVVIVAGMREGFTAQFVTARDGVALLTIDTTTSKVAHIDPQPELAVDQLVVALAGGEKLNIATGIITAVDTSVHRIETNIVGEIAPGTPLVNKDGIVIGLSTTAIQLGESTSFFSFAALDDLINASL